MRLHTPTDIGVLIRDDRKAQRLDQSELARRVGVGRQWIAVSAAIEKGKRRADLSLVLRTLNALGVVLRADEPSSPAPRRSGSVPTVNVEDILAAHRSGASRSG